MTQKRPPNQAQARPLLIALAKAAAARGQQVWLVGGTLRDLLLGHSPPDLDLAASGDAMELGRQASALADARFVPLKAEFQTCRLVRGELQLDLVGLRADDLEGDLGARDFTLNALALSLDDYLAGRLDAVLDPLGGRRDLGQGLLRLAGPRVLDDDPLRVLRAFRFMATHGFGLAPGLEEELSRAANGLKRMPRERIAHEWLLMMAGCEVSRAVRAMERTGALTILAPVLEEGRGLGQNPYHHLDIMGHNLACLDAMDAIARAPEAYMGAHAGTTRGYLAQNHRRRALLFTAALLHDVGKPPTRQEKEPGWATFYYHDRAGGGLANDACRRLGLSKADAAYVTLMVGEHMRPFQLMGAALRESLTPKAIRRLLAAMGEDLPALFMLAMADTMAGKGPERPPEAEERLLTLYDHTVCLRDEYLAQALAEPPLVNGNQVMAALGLEPGREVGRILNLLREAQLDGQIKTAAEALELAKTLLKEPAAG